MFDSSRGMWTILVQSAWVHQYWRVDVTDWRNRDIHSRLAVIKIKYIINITKLWKINIFEECYESESLFTYINYNLLFKCFKYLVNLAVVSGNVARLYNNINMRESGSILVVNQYVQSRKTTPVAPMLRPGMVGLAPKWVRLAPNGTNPGFFRSDFSAFGAVRQMHWYLIWKISGFVPFWANLTHFGAKPPIPAVSLLCLDWPSIGQI